MKLRCFSAMCVKLTFALLVCLPLATQAGGGADDGCYWVAGHLICD